MCWEGERPGSDPESAQHFQKPYYSLNVKRSVGVLYGVIFYNGCLVQVLLDICVHSDFRCEILYDCGCVLFMDLQCWIALI